MADDRGLEDTGLARAAWANRPVRRAVVSFAAFTMAEWVLGTAVALTAYAAAGALAVGLVGFRFAPAALAAIATASLADRRPRHFVLAGSALARALASGLAAVALGVGTPFWIVVALIWLDAVAGSVYRPAQAALLPGLVRTPGELTAGATLISNAKSTSQVLGAFLGGVLVAALPAAVVVSGAAGLYVVAGLLCLTLGDPSHPARQQARRRGHRDAKGRSRLQDLRTGAGTLAADREARLIVRYACLRSLVRGLWVALAVVAALRLLDLGPSGFGGLMAAAGAGAIAAIPGTALLAGRRRLASWFATGLTLCGLPLVATGLLPGPGLALGFSVVWGAGMALSDVGAQALLNRVVAAWAIGRATAFMESAKLLCEGLGSILAPALVLGLGIRFAVVASGMLLPLVVLIDRRGFRRVDDRAVDRVALLELLRGVPFFKPLRIDGLEGVATRLRTRRLAAGEVATRQGDREDLRWFVVAAGRLDVRVDGFVVGELQAGDQFGELALIRGVPRAATVSARTDVIVHTLAREDFLAAVAGPDLVAPEVPLTVVGVDRVDARTALAHVPLLRRVTTAALDRLAAQCQIVELDAGAPIVASGDRDDTYHVLLSGRAHVLVDGGFRRELLPGDAFGDIAVLHRVARTATVVARDPTTVLTLDGQAVRQALDRAGGSLTDG